MLNFYLILDVIVVLALAILAITVLLQNRTARLNRIFALFVLCIGVWIVANYISNDISNSPQVAVIANYFVFAFSYGASIFLLKFCIILADDKKALSIFRKLQVPLFLIAAIGATPLVVSGVALQGELYAVEFGPLMALYFLTLIGNIAAVIYVVKRNIKRTYGVQRARLKLLFKSLYWTFPVLLIAQAVLPALTGWFGLTNIGVMPMLILVFGLYYGVVRHRLFDLRLIVVRSLAYVATLGAISTLYGVVTHYVVAAISSSGDVVVRDVANIVLIIIAVLAYRPLLVRFNRLTNRFFYRDAYDAQVFFNEFNRALVSHADLDKLLHSSTNLIAATIKAEYCLVFLTEKTTAKRPQQMGTEIVSYSTQDIAKVIKSLEHVDDRLVVADYLVADNEALKSLMARNNIALIARMGGGNSQHELGYLILGQKKSGNAYTGEDMHVIEAVANELAIAVQNALRFEEIQAFAETLQHKIEEATRRLRQTNAKLKMIDQTKDDFISMASHQLRTPLTSVKGYVSMVLDGDAGELTPLQRKLLNQSFVSSQRMVYLISDLLNVSRLKTGKFIIEAVPTDLVGVVEDEIQQLKETAKGRSLQLIFNKPESFPTLMLDETKIRQVIMNFMDNAIYYTPSGGTITINLVEKPQSVEFTVVDNGIGVPKHEQHHLFSKFYRAHNAKRARPDGTGLGLFMAKKVIVAQGGALIFKSQEKKGSTFGFTFAKERLLPPSKPVS